VLVSIIRGDRLIVPRGEVSIQAQDRIAVFSSSAARASLDALLSGSDSRDDGRDAPTARSDQASQEAMRNPSARP